MRINNNIMALNTHRQLGINNNMTSKSLEKLSSGYRINRAGDDAAGLAISEKMRAQVRGLNQASRNAQDGISLIQTAEGALNETHAILQRMRELAVQSATDTNTVDDRAKIQSEMDQLSKEITRITNTTEFNTQNLMAGGFSSKFHIGANEGQNVDLSINAMDAKSLGVAGDITAYGLATNTTGVTGMDNASKDLTGYKIATLAKVSAAMDGSVTQGTGATGALTVTSPTAYTGSKDQTYTIKIDSVDGTGKVLTASISYDGGNTYNALTSLDSTGVNATATIDGMEITIATDASNQAGGTYTFKMTAEYKNVELQDSLGAKIGQTVKIYNNMSSATIGAGDSTLDIAFNYADLADGAATDVLTSTTTASEAAVIGAKGSIVKEAITYKGIDISTQDNADKAITKIDKAITTVSEERGKLGALQNRLEHTIKNLDTSAENLQASESRVRDVDMAKEMMEFTKQNILMQAATAMLAQANMAPQTVLKLLG